MRKNQVTSKSADFKIIAVDDEQGILDSLSIFMHRSGYTFKGITNPLEAIELVKKHIQDLSVTIIQITLDKEQVYSVQNLTEVLENAKEQIKVRNELIREYQEEEKQYRKGLVKKVIHIQSEKDFRNQEISRYKRKLKEYEESSIER